MKTMSNTTNDEGVIARSDDHPVTQYLIELDQKMKFGKQLKPERVATFLAEEYGSMVALALSEWRLLDTMSDAQVASSAYRAAFMAAHHGRQALLLRVTR